jgi:hypothetical protein
VGRRIAESFCVPAAVGLAAVWRSGATRPGALAFFATGPFADLARRSVSLVVCTHPRNAVSEEFEGGPRGADNSAKAAACRTMRSKNVAAVLQ